MVIRERTEADHDAILAVVAAVRELDGYPPFESDDGYRDFLFGSPPLAAWVAEIGGKVAGHVALHEGSLAKTWAVAKRALGRQTRLGVVARLVVSPAARGQHLGGALLQVATDEARARGLAPILDTVSRLEHAVALYERSGWTRIGEFAFPLDGQDLTVYVYAAP